MSLLLAAGLLCGCPQETGKSGASNPTPPATNGGEGMTGPPPSTPAGDTKKDAPPTRARSKKPAASPAGDLLERALRLEGDKEGTDWQHASAVKSLITRLDPAFSEKALGHRSFTDFVKAHPEVAEIDDSENIVLIRLAAGRR